MNPNPKSKQGLRVSVIAFIGDQIPRPQLLSNLLPQLTPKDELILIGSVDALPKVMLACHGTTSHIQALEYTACDHGELYKLYNQAARKAKGKYLAWFDEATIWQPGKLATELYALETQKLDFCCTNYILHREKNRRGSKGWKSISGNPRSGFRTCLIMHDFIRLGTVLMKKSTWQKTTGFPDYLGNKGELALWFRLAQTSICSVVNEPLVHIYSSKEFEIDRASGRVAVLTAMYEDCLKDNPVDENFIQILKDQITPKPITVVRKQLKNPWGNPPILKFPLD